MDSGDQTLIESQMSTRVWQRQFTAFHSETVKLNNLVKNPNRCISYSTTATLKEKRKTQTVVKSYIFLQMDEVISSR